MRIRLGFILLMVVSLQAELREYEIVPSEENRLALEVFKTGFMSGKKHLFHFEQYRGKLSYDDGKPESSRIELVLQSGSIALKDTWLSDKDFKKVQQYALQEMLAADRFSEILFSSGQIRAKSAADYEIQGTLSIRGVSKPVMVHVAKKQEVGGKLVFEGRSQIRMKEYGLKPPSAALGTIGTKDEMAFSFMISVMPR